MKRIFMVMLAVVLALSLAACGTGDAGDVNQTGDDDAFEKNEVSMSPEITSDIHEPVMINPSPDKYTWYIKDYVGKNMASLGYTSLGGDRRDSYGAASLALILVTEDGSYIDIEDEDLLKEYVVTAQDLAPNTELKLAFMKDSDGEEYSNLVEYQNYENIVLGVKKIGDSSKGPQELMVINPSPDKYTWYIRNYIGRNLATCGYASLGGDFRDSYGSSSLKLVIIADDGSYIDPEDIESLQNFVVKNQNITPNTELKLEFMKKSDGSEYDNLVDNQSIEEIELYVSRIN